MDTNVHDESTEHTEETDASQTSAIVLKSLLTICNLDQGGIGRASVCSAVRHAARRQRMSCGSSKFIVCWLGGSSRFAQAQTTSCGSLKFIVCWRGGSSRFAQAQTTSCGSLKFIVCWRGGCESASRGVFFAKKKYRRNGISNCMLLRIKVSNYD